MKIYLSVFLFLIMRTPTSLKSGDCIGIVAPGRKVGYQNVEAAANTFVSWGLKVVFAPNLFSDDHPYLASTDAKRSGDFQMMLDDERIRAIVCARGGYGTTRILDELDFSTLVKDPKWVVGFSDVTALHLKIFELGIESIHGIMPVLFDKPEYVSSITSLRNVLFGTRNTLASGSLKSNRPGVATGHVLGGNLSLLVDSLGTASEPILDEKILIIEEIDESLYKVDRMLTQLKRAGKLDKLAGLVVGHLTALKEGDLPFGETLEEIVLNKVGRFNYPVAFAFPIGHDSPNLAWIHGSVMTLKVDVSGSLLSPASLA
jgi:muramoyltetrapeptide carboxypeptidase